MRFQSENTVFKFQPRGVDGTTERPSVFGGDGFVYKALYNQPNETRPDNR